MAIITISRGSFSGGKELADDLGRALNYRVISREALVKGAKKYGISDKKFEEALDVPPGFWERFGHERRLYLAIVQATLCNEVKSNNVVYHGHAGHLLLKDLPHVIRVRIIAPMEYRLEHVLKRQKLSKEKALRYIHKKDEERIRWTKFLYGVDWHDPTLYDIVISLEKITIDCACEMVKLIALKKDEQWDEASQHAMDNLLLVSSVSAAMALNPETAGADIKVKAEEGIVSLFGLIRNERLIKDVIRVVSRVPGVKQVNRDGLG